MSATRAAPAAAAWASRSTRATAIAGVGEGGGDRRAHRAGADDADAAHLAGRIAVDAGHPVRRAFGEEDVAQRLGLRTSRSSKKVRLSSARPSWKEAVAASWTRRSASRAASDGLLALPGASSAGA